MLMRWCYDIMSSGGSKIFQTGFGKIFAENCTKMKEIEPRGGRASLATSLDPPMISPTKQPACDVNITLSLLNYLEGILV